jgi:5-methylthioadenosine/S-adenosylhomocysteine deaminase
VRAMAEQTILLRDCNILTPGKPVLKGRNVEIENGTITSVSSNGSSQGLVLDCSHKYVIPGFVNAHAHCYQNLMRGLGSDLKLVSWLREAKYPICTLVDEDDIYISTLIAHLEMMKSGITSVIDNFDLHNDMNGIRAAARAYADSGMRVAMARGMRVRTAVADEWKIPASIIPNDEKVELALTEQAIREFDGKLNRRMRVYPSPTALYYSTKELLLGAKALAERYGICMHIHVAEGVSSQNACLKLFGKREVELLDKLDVLDGRFQAVHATDLSESEIGILAKKGCTVIHNPISNMYLASGICPLVALVDAGVNIALGTDGAASNDSYSFFETMKTASLLQKIASGDAAAISAKSIFEMATLGGAKTMVDSRIGRVEVGYLADLAVVDLKRIGSFPDYRPFNNITYSCSPSNIVHVIVDGVPTILDGKFVGFDEAELIGRFTKSTERIERFMRSKDTISAGMPS